MDDDDPNFSIVEYMSDHSGYKCGYCKSPNTNFSHGMWAHSLTVSDYQRLINRGWRRSGQYCYKPTMDVTCCPMYTIRCEALDFRPSKSQKKVLKKMYNFLSFGKRQSDSSSVPENKGEDTTSTSFEVPESKFESSRSRAKKDLDGMEKRGPSYDALLSSNIGVQEQREEAHGHDSVIAAEAPSTSLEFAPQSSSTLHLGKKPCAGPDPSRPPCKKAKLLRKEKRALKQDGNQEQTLSSRSQENKEKTLQDLLYKPLPEKPAHHLEVKLVLSSSKSTAFQSSLDRSHDVHRKYQMKVHGDPYEKCTMHSFQRFLCKSPLKDWKPRGGPPGGYGSFHQQYWLDGKLIAVGVIDILPTCVSSVYLYYDPEYSFLSLGTYSSLREIALVQELNRGSPKIIYYYMGYYIHSCTKMRYKGRYFPSYLLCPETYRWHPIDKCAPLLDSSKYSVFGQGSSSSHIDIREVFCLYKRRPTLYGNIRHLLDTKDGDEDVEEYLKLVGNECAKSILLYRSS